MIAISLSTKSSTMDTILKPLLTEMKRRKSVRSKSISSGPLSGFRIDIGNGYPPTPHKSPQQDIVPLSPTPIRPPKSSSLTTPRRSLTPTRIRKPLIVPYRSFSAADGPHKRRPIARSSHLHAFEAEKVRQAVRDMPSESEEELASASEVEDEVVSHNGSSTLVDERSHAARDLKDVFSGSPSKSAL
jgi:hypothetical protein